MAVQADGIKIGQRGDGIYGTSIVLFPENKSVRASSTYLMFQDDNFPAPMAYINGNSILFGTATSVGNAGYFTGYTGHDLRLRHYNASQKIVFQDHNGVTYALYDLAGNHSLKSITYGGEYSRKKYEAAATLSGASTTLQTNIPTDTLIVGYQFVVEEIITSGDGATSWKATLSGGASDELFTGQAFTKNTKKKKRIAGIEAASEVDVLIEPDSGTFSGGKIACVFLVEEASDLDSFA